MIILFNKPFGVVSQFSGENKSETLAQFIPISQVYAAGRLDKDSEGLLVLTDDGKLQQRISHHKYKKPKSYWVQVEGEPDSTALSTLSTGIELKDGMTLPAQVKVIPEPELWSRIPPVRFRKHIPTSWLEISVREGRNRQIRRMTAAAGFPTLRLVRIQVGNWQLGELQPGEWLELEK